MSIKFKSKLSEIEVDGKIVQNKHRVIKHTDTVQDLVVTVVTKTVAHPEYGNGSASGFTIDGVEGAYLEFTQGITYKFDQSDSTNNTHPLLFYYESDKTTEYSTGVTTSGTPGSSGAYTQIVVNETTPAVLYYQCSAHSLMGSYVKFGTRNLTGFSITADEASSIGVNVKNKSGGSLSAGTVVHASPSANPPSGNIIEVIAADNSSATTMPAIGVLKQTLADDAEGIAIAFGRVSGLNTSAFSAGDSLYVNSSGGFTTTKPTGSTFIQKIGIVMKVHASSGTIEVFGANRTNDVPNITENYIWLGNASGVATPTLHNISNISDVNITSLADNQILKYDSSTSKWVNEADISGSGASNSFETIAVAGQNNVVADSSTDTLTLAAGDNVTLTTDAGNDTITIASSGGGGGGTVTVEKNIFTATAAQENFTITSAPDSINNLQIYLDGVYQAKDNYTVSGAIVTINTGTGVAIGAEVEIIHLKSVSGIITVDTFTGDGTDTTFNLTLSNSNENHTQIYLDGVYQSKNNYSIVSKIITFNTAPANGTTIEVVHLKAVDTSSLNINTFTGNGTVTDFTLSESIEDENKTFVFVQGVYQEKSNYSVNGTTLSFLTAPPNGFSIEVMAVGSVSFTTTGNANDAKYTPNLISSDTTAVAGNLYVFTASATLTLPLSPSNGDTVKISNRSTTETCIVARNSSKIMGLGENMTIDTAFSSFELIYTGSIQGWVII